MNKRIFMSQCRGKVIELKNYLIPNSDELYWSNQKLPPPLLHRSVCGLVRLLDKLPKFGKGAVLTPFVENQPILISRQFMISKKYSGPIIMNISEVIVTCAVIAYGKKMVRPFSPKKPICAQVLCHPNYLVRDAGEILSAFITFAKRAAPHKLTI